MLVETSSNSSWFRPGLGEAMLVEMSSNSSRFHSRLVDRTPILHLPAPENAGESAIKTINYWKQNATEITQTTNQQKILKFSYIYQEITQQRVGGKPQGIESAHVKR